MRALRRLRIPVLLFVNKIDRPGATEGRVTDCLVTIPDGTVSAVLSAAARLGGTAGPPAPRGDLVALDIELPAAQARPLRGRPGRAASVPGQAESDRGRNPSVRHAPGR